MRHDMQAIQKSRSAIAIRQNDMAAMNWMSSTHVGACELQSEPIDAIIGVSVPNLSGGYSTMMPNHHITKPVLIGEIQGNGQFDTVWQTPGLVVAQEWSPYLPDSKDLIADWRKPMNCGNFNVVSGKCGGKGK